MPVITRLETARRSSGYVMLYVDDEALGLISEQEVLRLELVSGMVLDESALRDLRALIGLAEALKLANGFIGHRPRSTSEVRQRLRRAKLDSDVIDAAIEKLLAQGLLDDKRFASLWVENRTAFKPRSPRMLEMELRQKGVDRATVQDTLDTSEGLDETQLALEAGRQRSHRLTTSDRDAFERSLSAFLARRGFGYEAVRAAIDTLWSELNGT
jgi:regulatory protein